MKKSISVIAAAVLAASMAASVNAADYSSNPNYSLPPAKPTAGVNSTVPAGSSLAAPFEVMSKNDIKVAVAKGEPVYASYETAQLKASAMALLAGRDGGVLTVVTKRYTAVCLLYTSPSPRDRG